jgi:hypothetical protein
MIEFSTLQWKRFTIIIPIGFLCKMLDSYTLGNVMTVNVISRLF